MCEGTPTFWQASLKVAGSSAHTFSISSWTVSMVELEANQVSREEATSLHKEHVGSVVYFGVIVNWNEASHK